MKLRFPTEKELIAGGVLVTVVVAVLAFRLGSSAKSVKEKAEKAPAAQGQAKSADRKATRATSLGRDALNLVQGQLDCLRGPDSERCIRDLFRLTPAAQGAAGRQGARGGVGPAGPSGPSGVRGPRGLPGRPGRDGTPCLASVDPQCIGPAGANGSDGSDGKDGANGRDGEPGRAPTSDEIADAVRAYCATRNECRGPAGLAGADSTVPGPQGPPGADSTVPGPQGPQGATGAAGSPPASFTFSFVDANGVQVTETCVDPDGDLAYTCTPG